MFSSTFPLCPWAWAPLRPRTRDLRGFWAPGAIHKDSLIRLQANPTTSPPSACPLISISLHLRFPLPRLLPQRPRVLPSGDPYLSRTRRNSSGIAPRPETDPPSGATTAGTPPTSTAGSSVERRSTTAPSARRTCVSCRAFRPTTRPWKTTRTTLAPAGPRPASCHVK